MSTGPSVTSLRTVFAGDRGRLLVGLLFAEFGSAVQSVAEAAVLPLASRDLHGASLYGATVAGPTLSAILLIVLGPALTARLGPGSTLAWSTGVYIAGVLLAVLAPTMGFVFAGRLLQGAAAGLLAGFGLTAVGTLYEDDVRPRVLSLFSVIWLLPSVVGPVANALVASFASWRWAMAWPALVVIAARIVIGRRSALLPRPESPPRTPLGTGVLVLAGLALATVAPALPSGAALACWLVGIVLAAVASGRLLRVLTGSGGVRLLGIAVFAGLNVAFFGGEGLVSLGMIEVTGGGVVAASIAFAAGGVAWSTLGLRPLAARFRAVAGLFGSSAIAAACLVLAAVMLTELHGVGAVVGTALAWGLAGAGMGIAYPVLSAGAFDDADAGRVARISAAVAFAETGGMAFAALAASGFYSVTARALPASAGIGGGYLIMVGAALAALVAAVTLARRWRNGRLLATLPEP